MAISTALTRALGIKVPIIQAAMMWAGLPPLAAAVSNAGGLGIITGELVASARKALRE